MTLDLFTAPASKRVTIKQVLPSRSSANKLQVSSMINLDLVGLGSITKLPKTAQLASIKSNQQFLPNASRVKKSTYMQRLEKANSRLQSSLLKTIKS